MGTILFVSYFTGIKVHVESGSPEHSAWPRKGKSFTKDKPEENGK